MLDSFWFSMALSHVLLFPVVMILCKLDHFIDYWPNSIFCHWCPCNHAIEACTAFSGGIRPLQGKGPFVPLPPGWPSVDPWGLLRPMPLSCWCKSKGNMDKVWAETRGQDVACTFATNIYSLRPTSHLLLFSYTSRKPLASLLPSSKYPQTPIYQHQPCLATTVAHQRNGSDWSSGASLDAQLLALLQWSQ